MTLSLTALTPALSLLMQGEGGLVPGDLPGIRPGEGEGLSKRRNSPTICGSRGAAAAETPIWPRRADP
jgi:hypothetical protein